MKLSFAWIFDHLQASVTEADVYHVVNLFNRCVAEVEQVKESSPQLETVMLGLVKEAHATLKVQLEDGTQVVTEKTLFPDAQIGDYFFVKRTGDQGYISATSTDFGASRPFALPAVSFASEQAQKKWKEEIKKDYLLDIDNKSITHRPDLWSHRGVAREIGALLDIPLKPIEQFLARVNIQRKQGSTIVVPNSQLNVTLESQECDRFSVLCAEGVKNSASPFVFFKRLVAIDARPINALVDISNYTMFDIGQPTHVFDGEKIEGKTVYVRQARTDETIQLLDKTTVTLMPTDIVIADRSGPCSLAGISGGLKSAVTRNTRTIIVESAHFDPVTIRRTALRVKVRTEAAMRFEKNIDRQATEEALLRFVHLAQDVGLQLEIKGMCTLSTGEIQKRVVAITHERLEQLLGMTIDPEQVIRLLQKIDFIVELDGSRYRITVPSFRATKDVLGSEDIVEEVGRLVGYDTIVPRCPVREMKPFSFQAVERTEWAKRLLAYAYGMHEVHNYGLFDESFLQKIGWQPNNSISIVNPLSEQWCRLVTTLIPHLLKNVYENQDEAHDMRFFENARVFRFDDGAPSEENMLAGILYSRHSKVDFYQGKALVSALLAQAGIVGIWKPYQPKAVPWYDELHTAVIEDVQGQRIGVAGLIKKSFLRDLMPGQGFIFEVDFQLLSTYRVPGVGYKQISKYPLVHRDVSCLVGYGVTVDQCLEVMRGATPFLIDVEPIDMFERPEWKDQRAVTFRYTLSSLHETMNKEETEKIHQAIIARLAQLQVVVR